MTTSPQPPYATAPDSSSDREMPVLAWRVHRLREDPRRLPLVIAAYAGALLLWAKLFPHPLSLFLPFGALTSAMAEYLFPVTYRLTTRGAYSNCLLTRLSLPWNEVKRATHGDDGVFLSPFAHPSRLDNFRGIRLAFAAGSDETATQEILETVRRYRPATPGAPSSAVPEAAS